MALKLMPGETRNYTFKLPDIVADIDTILVCFYQDEEKVLQYAETDTDNLYGIGGEGNENFLVCSMPREDTLLFENRIPAKMQIEWNLDGKHSVAKAQRISVGTYLNKEYLEV